MPNLTSTPQRPLPEGARSIALKENAELWQAFTEVEYDGDKVNLEPGRCYSTLGSMGLKTPVKSMKKLKKPEEQ